MSIRTTPRMGLRTGLPLILAALVVACGGGHVSEAPTPAPASTGLAYTNPTATSGWRLMLDPISTQNHLVFSIVGPAGESGRGIGFNLRTDGTVAFAKIGGAYIEDLGVFRLGNKDGATGLMGTTVAHDVYALIGGVKEEGRLLTVGAYQKDRRWPAVPVDQPLFRVAVDFDSAKTAALAPGTQIPFQVVRARAIPANIGKSPEDPAFSYGSVIRNYFINDVPVAVGTLATQ